MTPQPHLDTSKSDPGIEPTLAQALSLTALEEQGVVLGEAVLQELQSLRQRLAELEEAKADLSQVRGDLDRELQTLKDVIGKAWESRSALRDARKAVCTAINASMPDFFAKLAEDMGALGIRVERASEFAPALAHALASKRPAVIDVATDIEALAPTAVS